MSHELLKAGLATSLAIAAGGVAAGCGEGSGASPTTTDPNARTTVVLPQRVIDSYCDVPSIATGDYQSQIGAQQNLAKATGNVVKGVPTFTSKNPNKTAISIADTLKGNDAAIATADTIITAESGMTPAAVASASYTLFEGMIKNKTLRSKTCNTVIRRVLETNTQHELQATSGQMNIYVPTFANGDLNGINTVQDPNTAAQSVFTITPVAGAPNQALAEGISQSWGITPLGQFIQRSDVNGNAGGNSNSASTGESTGGGGVTSGGAHHEKNAGTGTGTVSGGSGPANATGAAPESGTPGTENSPSGGGTTPGTTPATTPNTAPPATSPPETAPPATKPGNTPPPGPPCTDPFNPACH